MNIIGLTLGLSIVFMIGLFVSDELSFDQFHSKKNELYRVVENQYYADQPVFPVAVTPTALGPSLKDDFPEIINYTRVRRQSLSFKLGAKLIMETGGIAVDEYFFDMFSFPIIQGSLEAFKNNHSIILTEELANKYFPNENPIGKLIELDSKEHIVAGVIQNVPKNAHYPFRYVTNFQNFLDNNPDRENSWGSNWLYTYVELDVQADFTAVNEKVVDQIKINNEDSNTEIYLQPLTEIYLGAVDFVVEAPRKGQMMYVKVFSIVAIFILLISCINFMNLSTARSAKRSKEIGLRKTVGASRSQLIFQFLSESVLFAVIAVILSVGIVALLLPEFNQFVNKDFDLHQLLDPAYGTKFTAFIFAAAILTGLLAGSYPAFVLSATKPISSLSGKIEKGKKGVFLRQALVILQFSISVILIIGTTVVYQQLQHIQNIDLGYNKDNIIYTMVPEDLSRVFANEIREQSGVINAGLGDSHPASVLNSAAGFEWSGMNPDEDILIHYMQIDDNYVSTMEFDLVQGRAFREEDSLAVMINESALVAMRLDNPIGQFIRATIDYEIVGIVKDFHFKSIHTTIEPLIVFKLTEANTIYIRYEPKEKENIVATIEQVWNEVLPGKEFNYSFLEEDFNEIYRTEQRTSSLSTLFAVIAIIISCLGLFGLVSYATEQRTKEIGVRKVLGASVSNLFLLLTGDFTKLIFISLIISIPLGWLLMDKWLESFAYRTELSIGVFIFSAFSAIAIALLTVSYQTLRASISNPVEAIRSE